MNYSATFMHKCNRFFLHARQRSYSPGVEGCGFDRDQEALVLFPHDVLRTQACAPIWCRTAAGGVTVISYPRVIWYPPSNFLQLKHKVLLMERQNTVWCVSANFNAIIFCSWDCISSLYTF